QLGGAGPTIAELVRRELKLKTHWAVPDYLQRSARHLASATDLAQAQAVGTRAVDYALAGKSGVMPGIRRLSDAPYRWDIAPVPLSRVANREKKVPKGFIRADGFGISAAARRYLAPLIQGQAPPPFGRDGLPRFVHARQVLVPPKLPPYPLS